MSILCLLGDLFDVDNCDGVIHKECPYQGEGVNGKQTSSKNNGLYNKITCYKTKIAQKFRCSLWMAQTK